MNKGDIVKFKNKTDSNTPGASSTWFLEHMQRKKQMGIVVDCPFKVAGKSWVNVSWGDSITRCFAADLEVINEGW